MMKVIKIDAPDGQYTLPLLKVAKHRSNEYYNQETERQSWDDEIDYVMFDSFEGIDWIMNNTNYEDWKDDMTKINSDVNVTMDDFWCDSDGFEIVEID